MATLKLLPLAPLQPAVYSNAKLRPRTVAPGASGCFSEWDTEGNVFYDSCAEGDSLGDDGGEPAGVYDEATGCWVNDFGDGTIENLARSN